MVVSIAILKEYEIRALRIVSGYRVRGESTLEGATFESSTRVVRRTYYILHIALAYFVSLCFERDEGFVSHFS